MLCFVFIVPSWLGAQGEPKLNKRGFALGLAALAACPVQPFAQPSTKVWHLGWLSPADGPGPNHDAFVLQMKRLGYEEGKNLRIHWVWAGQSPSQLNVLATHLVQERPDALVAQTQACALALQGATKSIPIVFVGVRDPVLAGLVSSMGRPGGNLTGVTLTPNAELVQKHLELLTEIIPTTTRLAVFWNPEVPVQAQVVATIQESGRKRGIAVRAFEVHRSGDIERSFRTFVAERPDGLLTLVEWYTLGQRSLIAKLAIEARIPTFFEVKDYVTAGGLLSYGVVYHEHYAAAAGYVDNIFKGIKAAELPVQEPAKLEMVINLKTAKALGINIPSSVLLRANEVIE